MRIVRYSGDLEPLTLWAVNREQAPKTAVPPEPYPQWVKEVMPEGCKDDIRYWVGVITPESKLNGEWVDKYPHTHINSMGWDARDTTVILYLSVADVGGEFAIGGLNEADPYDLVTTTKGMGVVVDAATWHGVRPVKAGTRIALIATGFYRVSTNND